MDASLARGSPSRDLSPPAPQSLLPATPWPHQRLSASACLPALAAWYMLRREEVVPMRPTSQGGKRPAHRTPRGNQCTAFARSARLLSRVKTSDDIFASKALRLLLGSWLVKVPVELRSFCLSFNTVHRDLTAPRSRERSQRTVLSVHHRAESTWRTLASAAQATCSQG